MPGATARALGGDLGKGNMKTPEEMLLGGHAFGTLTDDERRKLYAAALEDQELFNLLADEEPLRELLKDRSVRRDLLEALEKPTPFEALRAFLGQSATWAHLVVATAALVVLVVSWKFLLPQHLPAPRAAAGAPALLVELFGLPEQQPIPASLQVGEGRLTFFVGRDAQVMVVAQAVDGSLRQLFPNLRGTAAVGAGTQTTVKLVDGHRRIRLVVFPRSVNPLALDPHALAPLAEQVTVIERIDNTPQGKPIQ
jgi:hypothetical protein